MVVKPWKNSRVFEWHNLFKMVARMWKTMRVLITFFDIMGIFHFELIPQGQTVNQAYYVEILKRLHETLHRKRPKLWPHDWILHHDNVRAHNVPSVKQFLAKKSINEIEHPTCSPDLGPNDLKLFPKINSALKGRSFQDIEDIKICDDSSESCSTQELQKCFQQ
jgi:hypothetical protein